MMNNEAKNYSWKLTDFLPFGTLYRDRIQPGWRDMSMRERRESYLKLSPNIRAKDILATLGGKMCISVAIIAPFIYYFAEEIGEKIVQFEKGLEAFF